MPGLEETIRRKSDRIVLLFEEEGLNLDYSVASIIEVDRFFGLHMKNGNPRKGGRLRGRDAEKVLLSIGAYIGETIIRNVGGAKWCVQEEGVDVQELPSLLMPDDTIIWPMEKVFKRFKFGNGDALYPYVHMVTMEFTQLAFESRFWAVNSEEEEHEKATRPWWKFW